MKSQNKTILAGEALSKYRFVDNEGKHTVDIKAIGATKFAVDSGDPIPFQNESSNGGVVVVEAGGVITVGTHPFVSMDADGKAVALTPAAIDDVEKICAVPLDSATADGDFIRVKMC